jgi:stress-induced-phosphoprotein 1
MAWEIKVNTMHSRTLTNLDGGKMADEHASLLEFNDPSQNTQPKEGGVASLSTEFPSEARLAADAQKLLGNAAYKERKFDEAIKYYREAWRMFKDITYLTNLSAAYFEKGDYENSIVEAFRAIEMGKELSAEAKLVARFFRIKD